MHARARVVFAQLTLKVFVWGLHQGLVVAASDVATVAIGSVVRGVTGVLWSFVLSWS